MDLLQLLASQQGEEGVRLTFLPGLLDRPRLATSPFTYCATTGNLSLLCLLHARGVPLDQPVQVAALCGRGPAGTTPWHKHITVQPAEAALVAGHDSTAKALALVQRGVPLFWSRGNHSRWPQNFKNNVHRIVAACISSPGFVALPGPVRVAALDLFVRAAAHATVWSMLPVDVWAAERNPAVWERMVGDLDLLRAAEALPVQHGEGRNAGGAGSQGRRMQYQFRVAGPGHAHRRRRAKWGLLCALARGALCGHLALEWVHHGGGEAAVAAAAALSAGGAFPVAMLGAMASAALCQRLLR